MVPETYLSTPVPIVQQLQFCLNPNAFPRRTHHQSCSRCGLFVSIFDGRSCLCLVCIFACHVLWWRHQRAFHSIPLPILGPSLSRGCYVSSGRMALPGTATWLYSGWHGHLEDHVPLSTSSKVQDHFSSESNEKQEPGGLYGMSSCPEGVSHDITSLSQPTARFSNVTF